MWIGRLEDDFIKGRARWVSVLRGAAGRLAGTWGEREGGDVRPGDIRCRTHTLSHSHPALPQALVSTLRSSLGERLWRDYAAGFV